MMDRKEHWEIIKENINANEEIMDKEYNNIRITEAHKVMASVVLSIATLVLLTLLIGILIKLFIYPNPNLRVIAGVLFTLKLFKFYMK